VQISQLGYFGLDGHFILEPGPITVLVVAASDDIRLRASFDVVGEPVHLLGNRTYLSEATVRAV
jgi:beta-xylosidase